MASSPPPSRETARRRKLVLGVLALGGGAATVAVLVLFLSGNWADAAVLGLPLVAVLGLPLVALLLGGYGYVRDWWSERDSDPSPSSSARRSVTPK